MTVVQIGNQQWMLENLGADYFRNGDAIPEAKTEEEWLLAGENKQPAWCYFENDKANGQKYGKLYNWYAVNDARGLAPEGWHVPTDLEWKMLSNQLGGEDFAGEKMKSSSGWNNQGNDSNSTGFTGLPGGCRGYDGDFHHVGSHGYWWSASENDESGAWVRRLDDSYPYLNRGHYHKENGFSIRCVRD